MASSQSKKKPIDAAKVINDILDASNADEITLESPKTPSNEFVWVNPSPALHDRLSALLRRRGTVLDEVMGVSEDITPTEYIFSVREFAGFDRVGELNDEIWLAVIARLER